MGLFARLRLAAGIILAAILGIAWLWSRWSGPSARLADLEAQASEQVRKSEQQFRGYLPGKSVRLDDLDSDAVALLSGLPGVARVVRDGPEKKPSARIVHLCDARLKLAESLHVAPDSDAFRAHIASADVLQEQQTTVLRCLARHHGVKVIHAEGLADVSAVVWRANVALLKDMLSHEKELEGANANDLVARMRQQRRLTGAAGLVDARGEAKTLPLETRLGGGSNRDAAIVERLLAAGPLAVVVLDGGRDLKEEIRRQGLLVQYLRVEVDGYSFLASPTLPASSGARDSGARP
jgi:hypothetical protein